MDIFEESEYYYDQNLNFLKLFSFYEKTDFKFPPFVYEFNAKYLVELEQQFHVIHDCSEYGTVKHVLELMNFVYENLFYKEQIEENMVELHAVEILQKVKEQRKGSNCLAHATVMTEVLLANRYYARTIRCIPIGTMPYDVHNLTIVYVKEIKKWMVLDPTYNLFFSDEDGRFLSLSEIKEYILNNKCIKICTNHRFKNINVNFLREKYMKYMVKNLFRFQSSVVVNKKINNKNKIRIYELCPKYYLPYKDPLTIRDYENFQILYIYDDNFFWQNNLSY